MNHIYINDLNSRIISNFDIFPDNTKTDRLHRSNHDAEILQGTTNYVSGQKNIRRSLMLVVGSVGKRNHSNNYTLNDTNLGRSNCEPDFRVLLVSSDLRPRNQCVTTKNRAHGVSGFIARSVRIKSIEVILRLCLTPVRSHVDYLKTFWVKNLTRECSGKGLSVNEQFKAHRNGFKLDKQSHK